MMTASYSSGLLAQHAALLEASAITPEVAAARGYVSAEKKAEMERRGFGASQRHAPALLVPLHGVTGEPAGWQARPDNPRWSAEGRPVKYETPSGQHARLDVHPMMRAALGDPEAPLIVTEGIRKGDSAVSVLDVPAVSLTGVWSWRGTNDLGGQTVLAQWEYVTLAGRTVLVVFDSDVMLKEQVHAALGRLGAWLRLRRAEVRYVYLPHGEHGAKVGLDDYLAAGHNLDDLLAHADEQLRRGDQAGVEEAPAAPPPEPRTLAEVVEVFTSYIKTSDLVPLYAVLAGYLANLLPGDAVWLGVVGGSSRGKTELLNALGTCPHVVGASSLSGPAALLSMTPTKERTSGANGGLLARIGPFGVLSLKDFTSVLDMNRDSRAGLLAALREVYDGRWTRDAGSDGGRTVTWTGKLGLLFGVTTAIDAAHGVMATMGERFMLVRVPGGDDLGLAHAALGHIGDQAQMRTALADAVAGLVSTIAIEEPAPAEGETWTALAAVATLAARSRSPVMWDLKGTAVELVGDAEGPPRLTKALDRLRAGLVLLGLDPVVVRDVVVRVGRDTIPKGRRQVLDVLIGADWLTTRRVADDLGLPTKSAWRRLAELEAHGVIKRKAGKDLDDHDARADYWRTTDWTDELVAMFRPETSVHHEPPPSLYLIPHRWGQSR